MTKSPAYQWYPDKAAIDTRRLSWEAKGIYRELLDVIWLQFQDTCSIPDDDRFIASELNCEIDKWKSAREEIMNEHRPLFDKKDGERLFNKGLWKERKKQKEWRRKSSEGGKASAKTRAKNRRDNALDIGKGGLTVVDDSLQPKGNSPSPSPSPIPKKNNIPKNTFKQWELGDFRHEIRLSNVPEIMSRDMCTAFFEYWTEPDSRGKPRYQKQATWETSRRMRTWANNNFGGNQKRSATEMNSGADGGLVF